MVHNLRIFLKGRPKKRPETPRAAIDEHRTKVDGRSGDRSLYPFRIKIKATDLFSPSSCARGYARPDGAFCVKYARFHGDLTLVSPNSPLGCYARTFLHGGLIHTIEVTKKKGSDPLLTPITRKLVRAVNRKPRSVLTKMDDP